MRRRYALPSGLRNLVWTATACLSVGCCASEPTAMSTLSGTIKLTVMDTLNMGSDSVGFLAVSQPVGLSDGRTIIAPLSEPGKLALFGARGEFLGFKGRPGPGPGELGGISRIVPGRDGGLRIFHGSYGSKARLGGDSLQVLNAIPMTEFSDIVQVGDSQFAATVFAFPGSGLSPVRLLDSTLTALKGFESPFSELDGDLVVLQVADARDGGIVVSPLTGYAFARIDVASGEVRHIPRAVNRFPISKLKDLDRRQPNVARPYPRIIQIQVDDDGLLRVLYAQARPDWAPTVGDDDDREGSIVPAEQIPRYMQILVDILDLETGALVAHGELPALMRMLNDSTWIGYTSLPDDDIGVVRYRVQVN